MTDEREAEARAIATRMRSARALLIAKLQRPGPAIWWNDVGTDEFISLLVGRITPEEAVEVRALRTRGTWRAVADACHRAFRERWGVDWVAGQTQEVGMAICIAAAHVLDEDVTSPPWSHE